ncbi:recombinase RecA [Patescibacteria group bacterium]
MAMEQIDNQYGKGSIMRLGERDAQANKVLSIPTGSVALDMALGVGGFPRGRIVEIYGPEASGKTTLALHVIAEAQKTGGQCAFVDAEHALDPARAEVIGVNLDELLLSQPDTGEQALEITETLIRSGGLDAIVVDSVAALVPRAELEGEMGDAVMGMQARLMSQALRKLTGVISKSKTTLIFTNQIRQKIGVMFGNPETTPGGLALKFYSSVRVDVRRIEILKDGDNVIGSRHRARIVKNKVAPPLKVAEFDIMNDEGISKTGGLLDVAVTLEIIEKKGAFYYYEGKVLAQGRGGAKEVLKDDPKLAKKIDLEIRKMVEKGKDIPKEIGDKKPKKK